MDLISIPPPLAQKDPAMSRIFHTLTIPVHRTSFKNKRYLSSTLHLVTLSSFSQSLREVEEESYSGPLRYLRFCFVCCRLTSASGSSSEATRHSHQRTTPALLNTAITRDKDYHHVVCINHVLECRSEQAMQSQRMCPLVSKANFQPHAGSAHAA